MWCASIRSTRWSRSARSSSRAVPDGIAADHETGTLWVTLTERNQVVGLDVSSEEPIEIDRLPTVRQPNTVAVSPGADTVWVTGTYHGEVQRIER